jgi:uncharacterized protein (TIGR02757 family)
MSRDCLNIVTRNTVPLSRKLLETYYHTYNRKRFIHPDPIEFILNCSADDREVIGLLAASLAYGRVAQILTSVQNALSLLPSPSEIARHATLPDLARRFSGFKHRFTTGTEVAGLLFGAGAILRHSGSLGAFVAANQDPAHENVLGAMTVFANTLVDASDGRCRGLVSDPAKGSACKRLNMYFRWMVRKDRIDPGGWPIRPAKLIIPLDTHMHRFARIHGLTARKAADMKTALEITEGFRKFSPADPVRYDFSVTRLGILKTAGYEVGFDPQHKEHR